jgi:glycosyltransferase involved in cell wall biosynthesis
MQNSLLSIFIPTFNRANLIGQTLNKFIEQVKEFNIPIIISDNYSTDNTFEVVQTYKKEYPLIQYYRNNENLGFDKNILRMSDLVNTKYCWLFGDDDIINDNAIITILDNIKSDYDLIIVNSSLYSLDLSEKLKDKHHPFEKNKVYKKNSKNEVFSDMCFYTSFIGCLIVNRNEWIKVDFNKYLNTGFIHIGIVYEYLNNSSTVMFISDPLVSIRLGNSGWTYNSFEMWYINWGNVIRNLPNYPENLKKNYILDINNISIKALTFERAKGSFRYDIYKKYIKPNASIPSLKKEIIRFISLSPKVILTFMWLLYLNYKRPSSFEYNLYELKSTLRDIKYL